MAESKRQRLYHVEVVNERTGKVTRMTSYPATHREAVTIRSKMVPDTERGREHLRTRLVEAPQREKGSLDRTYLCAVKFWSSSYQGGTMPDYRGPTLIKGVRHVVRKQGFASRDIYKVEERLENAGLIQINARGPGQKVKLTPSGRKKAQCSTVKLAPWTDEGNPGAQLSGGRCKNGRVKSGPRKGMCRLRPKRRKR